MFTPKSIDTRMIRYWQRKARSVNDIEMMALAYLHKETVGHQLLRIWSEGYLKPAVIAFLPPENIHCIQIWVMGVGSKFFFFFWKDISMSSFLSCISFPGQREWVQRPPFTIGDRYSGSI